MQEMAEIPSQGIVLQKLSERHKQAAALLAQGVPRSLIAEAVQYTPEYITWLGRQPLFIQYIKEMSEVSSVQLEAMFGRSVEIIGEGMQSGGELGLKAAKLQLEATGRVGRYMVRAPEAEAGDRLEVLAERLVGLMKQRQRRTLDGEATVVQE